MKSDNQEENAKLDALIRTTSELIDEYTIVSANKETSNRASRVEVAAFIAVFELFGYDLAAELLTHALDNTDLDSYYEPVNGDDVLCSEVFNSIRDGDSQAGSASFENEGTRDEKDLFFAIHLCYYRKSDSGKVVIIQDRYDFEEGAMGESLVGDVVNLMYNAQEAGIKLCHSTHIL